MVFSTVKSFSEGQSQLFRQQEKDSFSNTNSETLNQNLPSLDIIVKKEHISDQSLQFYSRLEHVPNAKGETPFLYHENLDYDNEVIGVQNVIGRPSGVALIFKNGYVSKVNWAGGAHFQGIYNSVLPRGSIVAKVVMHYERSSL